MWAHRSSEHLETFKEDIFDTGLVAWKKEASLWIHNLPHMSDCSQSLTEVGHGSHDSDKNNTSGDDSEYHDDHDDRKALLTIKGYMDSSCRAIYHINTTPGTPRLIESRALDLPCYNNRYKPPTGHDDSNIIPTYPSTTGVA